MPDNDEPTGQGQLQQPNATQGNNPATQNNDPQTGQAGQPGASTTGESWRPGEDPAGQPAAETTSQEPGQAPSNTDDDTATKDRSQTAGGGGGGGY